MHINVGVVMSKFVLPQTRRGWFQNLLDGIGELVQGRHLESARKLIEVAKLNEKKATIDQKAILNFHHGNVEIGLGNIIDGLAFLKLACKISPSDAFIRINCAISHMNFCLFSEAGDIIRDILDHPQYGPRAWQCYYYISLMGHEANNTERHRIVREYGTYLSARGLVDRNAVPLKPIAGRKVRIGYLHNRWSYPPHQTILLPLVQNHDRGHFTVFCYGGPNNFDVMPPQIEATADGCVSLAGLSSDQAIRRIQQDEIDILVDLDGFTTSTPIDLYAARPAPILVTWFGALSSYGCDLFDYVIADPIACPPAIEQGFAERVLKMPNSYLAFGLQEIRDECEQSPCVANGYVTFGSCNRPDKMNQSLIDCWARIVERTPGSRLALYHDSYAIGFWRDRMLGFLQATGLPEDRYCIAVAPTKEAGDESKSAHCLGYDHLDIVLDSVPFNAVTSTFEALRLGVPVVTCRGDEWRGRIGASLLTTAGLSELVADDLAGFEQIASDLAMDRDRLVALRQQVQQRLLASPLVDTQRFTRHLEALYEQMIAARS